MLSSLLGSLIFGLATAVVAQLTPVVKSWILAKTHNQALAQAVDIGGSVAYQALVDASHQGGDLNSALKIALQSGIAAVNKLPPATVSQLTQAAVESAVTAGLGKALSADPTIGPKTTSVAVTTTSTAAPSLVSALPTLLAGLNAVKAQAVAPVPAPTETQPLVASPAPATVSTTVLSEASVPLA